jgi:hypothetical protein
LAPAVSHQHIADLETAAVTPAVHAIPEMENEMTFVKGQSGESGRAEARKQEPIDPIGASPAGRGGPRHHATTAVQAVDFDARLQKIHDARNANDAVEP